MTLKFECPHCGQHISAESESAGQGGDCPNCNQPIIVPDLPNQRPPPARQTRTTAPRISTQRKHAKPKRYQLIPPIGMPIPEMTAQEVIAACKERKVITSAAKAAEYKGWGFYHETRPIRDFAEFAPHVWDTTLKDAEFNPHPDAQCYLFMRGDQSGPFFPAQIRTMWKAGSITSDALFYYPQLPDWRPVRSFCHSTDGESESTSSQSSGGERRDFGVFLTIIGIVVTIYFAAFYDVSVTTESRYISGIGTIGGDSVVNLGKQQNRLIGVIVGLALSTVGVIMICLPTNTNEA